MVLVIVEGRGRGVMLFMLMMLRVWLWWVNEGSVLAGRKENPYRLEKGIMGFGLKNKLGRRRSLTDPAKTTGKFLSGFDFSTDDV